jgi:hypothetical protein
LGSVICWAAHLSRLNIACDLTFAISSPIMGGVTEHNNAPGKVIYLGACLIAAVRLAREERWDNSPRVVSRIADAIQLAKRIYERMQSDFGRDAESR